jgi:hypothetical protein
MGIHNLRDINKCLLASWVHRYNDSNSKLWREIIDTKYHTSYPNVFCCRDRNNSPFWKGVMWAAKAAKIDFRWKISDGKKIRF